MTAGMPSVESTEGTLEGTLEGSFCAVYDTRTACNKSLTGNQYWRACDRKKPHHAENRVQLISPQRSAVTSGIDGPCAIEPRLNESRS